MSYFEGEAVGFADADTVAAELDGVIADAAPAVAARDLPAILIELS